MKEFDVYFEMYGKKMKVVIKAENEEQAKYIVRGKVIFHKVEKKQNNPLTDFLNDFLKQ